MSTENDYEKDETKALSQIAVSSRFVNVKLKRDIVEGMISTYVFLVWSNSGDDKKECQKILKALKNALS
jgi:hypothetical protein